MLAYTDIIIMNIKAHFLSSIKALIDEKPEVFRFFDVETQRILGNLDGVEVPELERLMLRIKRFDSSLSQNLFIAVRLFGGITELSHEMSESSELVLSLLNSDDDSGKKRLASAMLKLGVIPEDFFKKNRPFFSDDIVTSNRSLNLSRIFSTATDVTELHRILSDNLSPNGDEVLACLINAKSHARASWACRKLERILEIERGILDSMPRYSN